MNRVSDAEKERRGTLKTGETQIDTAKREIGKVLAFPAIKNIPEPSFPLNEKGMATYREWTQKLRDVGLLTSVSLGRIETLALLDHSIAKAMEVHKSPPNSSMDGRRKIMDWLDGLNVDTTVISGETKKGTFSSNGFPNRLRTPAEHRARLAG